MPLGPSNAHSSYLSLPQPLLTFQSQEPVYMVIVIVEKCAVVRYISRFQYTNEIPIYI